MTLIRAEHENFLLRIKENAGHCVISIWDEDSTSPLGTLLASQTFTGSTEGSQRQAAEMLAKLSARPLSSVLQRLNWHSETNLNLITN